ncbi:MAG: hypothetical protein ABSG98_04555 [Anaerolineales bacterium]|jgi:GNAT superfamily N-acetyltransferase
MITVEKIDTQSRAQVRRFVRFPFWLYANHPQWVPPLLMDSEMQLNRQKHPFFEHSDGDFFIAVRDGRDVGRIAALENRPYNRYHDTHEVQFYFFDCLDDLEVASALFNRVFEWAHERGLDEVVGPKGLSPFDGYGIQVEGTDRRQMMTMMNYNYPYYSHLVESLGFGKVVDFVSCYIDPVTFHLPERVRRVAEWVEKRGTLKVVRFRNKRDLVSWAGKIGEAYNKTFVKNWEYYPLTEREIKFVVDQLMVVADHRLIKIITHEDEVVGFLFAFPDLSAALQRAHGHLLPFGLPDLLLEMRRTKWISLNGVGMLPEFQGIGGNALMYLEMEKTIGGFHFHDAELTQVAESARQMRHDLENLGSRPYKNHRVYGRKI